MEIDKAVRESNDRRLQTKYNNAVYVIQRAFALYAFEEVAFSFNGGKDSTVLLHLLRAGYFLHNQKANYSSCCQTNCKQKCPIRTIYFESPSAFPEINSFTYETATAYELQMEIIRLDFKSGLEALLEEKPTKAIFLGTRIGDPNAVGQEQFSPSSPGWPPFMRVNPILDWSYRDIWAFLLTCKLRYCSLYDQGYTSIGSIHDTVPNALLCTTNSSGSKGNFRPAYLLPDGRMERAGRAKRFSPVCEGSPVLSNGLNNVDPLWSSTSTASVIAVGDEILFGTVEDQLGPALSRKLHSIGWAVTHISVVRNNTDSIAEAVEHQKSTNDMVFIFGGVGPMHSDVSVAGVAKAFGVRLAPDEEFEEHLRHLIGDQCTGDRNEIKCENVIILSATNVTELDKQWNCLLELSSNSGLLVLKQPFVSKHLSTQLPDLKTAPTLSKLNLEFPDLYIGCFRESRLGPLIVTLVGKDQARIEMAVRKLRQEFHPSAFSEVKQG
ncbi:uncharacterized protein LOC131226016 isoform X2 [Magnolia sinica]|uniref:uncharacterized protein LOC131226016 isoform X2 n=1 Tax=Magnolia sinica TaxID=86752 RepID=UPI0026594A98|nr:uncharacterized protein LOC131226016 isoform X2 [Magnolia sinica]